MEVHCLMKDDALHPWSKDAPPAYVMPGSSLPETPCESRVKAQTNKPSLREFVVGTPGNPRVLNTHPTMLENLKCLIMHSASKSIGKQPHVAEGLQDGIVVERN